MSSHPGFPALRGQIRGKLHQRGLILDWFSFAPIIQNIARSRLLISAGDFEPGFRIFFLDTFTLVSTFSRNVVSKPVIAHGKACGNRADLVLRSVCSRASPETPETRALSQRYSGFALVTSVKLLVSQDP